MSTFSVTKDSDAILDYSFDWTEWLVDGDSIDTSEWTADTGITVDDDSVSSGVTTVWLSGGTPGLGYLVTNHIVTNAGREEDRTLQVQVIER